VDIDAGLHLVADTLYGYGIQCYDFKYRKEVIFIYLRINLIFIGDSTNFFLSNKILLNVMDR
jgi:hypothetical protein